MFESRFIQFSPFLQPCAVPCPLNSLPSIGRLHNHPPVVAHIPFHPGVRDDDGLPCARPRTPRCESWISQSPG